MPVLVRAPTAAATTKAAPALFDQLQAALKGEGEELVQRTKASCSMLNGTPRLPAPALLA